MRKKKGGREGEGIATRRTLVAEASEKLGSCATDHQPHGCRVLLTIHTNLSEQNSELLPRTRNGDGAPQGGGSLRAQRHARRRPTF